MHLNHVLLATALALFLNNEGVVTAGNPDTMATQVEQVDQDEWNDGKNSTGPEQHAVLPVTVPAKKLPQEQSPEQSPEEEIPVKKVPQEQSPEEEIPAKEIPATKGGAVIGFGLGSREESDAGDSWDRSDDSDMTDASGSSDDSSEFEDALGSFADASESADASGSSAAASESADASGSSAAASESADASGSTAESESGSDGSDSGSGLDDLFSMSGSDGFDAWLKSLGGLGLTSSESGSDEDASGSEEPTKAPKKKKEADSSASDMMNFDDFFADLKGSGVGGGFGALMGTPAPVSATGTEASGLATSGSDQSQNATPQCDEGKWSRFKAWWGKWLHITTDKDCPPDTPVTNTAASSKLRPD